MPIFNPPVATEVGHSSSYGLDSLRELDNYLSATFPEYGMLYNICSPLMVPNLVLASSATTIPPHCRVEGFVPLVPGDILGQFPY